MNRFAWVLAVVGTWFGIIQTPGASFSSTTGLTFPDLGVTRTASPFPSTITVPSGVLPAGNITDVRVTLNNLSHSRPADMEMVLVSPWGARFIFFADVSGGALPVSGLTIVLDDDAGTALPTSTSVSLTSGTFRPTCAVTGPGILPDLLSGSGASSPGDAAAPLGTATFTTKFGGASNPVGTWSLYAVDDVTTDDAAGSIGSWTLDIEVSPTTVATTTLLTSSANPSTTGNSVTFTATVTKASDASAVTSGSVTFKNGATVLVSGVPLNGSGQAAHTLTTLAEGTHVITAEYTPGTGLLASSGSLSQQVNNATQVSGNTFSNPGALTFPGSGSGAANVYPSRVFVTGLAGTISKVTLTVSGVTINPADDLELLLVAPGGRSLIVLSDAGGTLSGVSGINLTLDDAASSLLPDSTTFSSGTFRPTSHASSSFPSPAPAGPHPQPAPMGSGSFANQFAGSSPNGTWSLFALDDVNTAGGSISGGWSLTFTTTGDAATTTTVSSSPNPSVTGSSVTFTATVVHAGNGSPVTSGSVSFREGSTALAGPVAVNGAGQATFSTAALAEGSHTISADYGGSAGSFNLSTGSMTHQVRNLTVVNGESSCNTGVVLTQAGLPGLPAVYPSVVTVSGRNGPISKVTLTLKSVSVNRPDDAEVLLVSPSGSAFLVMGDSGGTSVALSGADLQLEDGAANLIPDTGPMAAGTFRPTNHGSTASAFPSPAPSLGSIQHPSPTGAATFASVFNGEDPNGDWLLFVMSDTGISTVSLQGGWCVGIETDDPPVAEPDGVTRDKDRSVKVPIATLLSNDSDPEGETPVFVGVASNSTLGASVRRVGSWIEYQAVPGSNALDTFLYTISDGTSTTQGTVSVTVVRPEAQTVNLVAVAQGADVRLLVSGIPGRSYQFQTASDLTSPVLWSDLGGPQVADDVGRVTYIDVGPPSPRFYRAIQP